MRWNEILERLGIADLRTIEREIRPNYNKHGLDPVLTDRHFIDRVNDTRNEPPINYQELGDFMKNTSKPPAVVKLAAKTPGEETLVSGPSSTDPSTTLNIPFIISNNPKNHKIKNLVAKTIMRKNDFKSSDKDRISSEMTPEQLRKLEILKRAGLR